ncbi:MAG: 4Fe-4S binding protein [Thermodesulfobacteriota bacterium]
MLKRLLQKDEGIQWDRDAEQSLATVPLPLRPMVRRMVESMAAKENLGLITRKYFEKAKEKTRPKKENLSSVMPAKNRRGVPMVLVAGCHEKMAGCENPLLDTDQWIAAVNDRAQRTDLSERLRKRVQGDTIYMHDKIKVSISGCPNGCSRPQIADIGITGAAVPTFDPALCTGCGACLEACPDRALALGDSTPLRDGEKCQGCRKCQKACPAGAVSLGSFGARLLLGGKLGRHPHLAEPAGVFETPEDLLAAVGPVLDRYIANAKAGERLADFLLREKERAS